MRTAVPSLPGCHFNLGVELLNDGKLDEGNCPSPDSHRHLDVSAARHLPAELPSRADVISAREDHRPQLQQPTPLVRRCRTVSPDSDNRSVQRTGPSSPLGGPLFVTRRRAEEAIVRYRAYLSVQQADADTVGRLGSRPDRDGQDRRGDCEHFSAQWRLRPIAPQPSGIWPNLAS